ncbi:hypothetical protein FQR65_LT06695 [Abscondita terminalis]|nr:hypothetical protein FQR65_LT06695 [Abscondita terminalis]
MELLTNIIISVLFVLLLLLIRLYATLTTKWNRSPVCLVGKTAIITGSNTGIGYYTALDFAKRGARVILACRNATKAEDARSKIIQSTGNENVVVKLLDLSSLESVRKFVKNVNETEDRLHILVNNAGALLKKSAPSRVVVLSSMLAFFGRLNINKLNSRPRIFSDAFDYVNTKFYNLLFTVQLAKVLQNTGVTVNAVHPGVMKSDILKETPTASTKLFCIYRYLVYKNVEAGAQTSTYVAIAKELDGVTSQYFKECAPVGMPRLAQNEKLAKQLWDKSLEFVKLTPDEQQCIVTTQRFGSTYNHKEYDRNIKETLIIVCKKIQKEFKVDALTIIFTIIIICIVIKFYIALTTRWNSSPTCLVGKTAIVTGSNTGIGFYTSLDFAKRGARVILACRNVSKAEEAKNKIIDESGNKDVVVKILDLSSLDSVRQFAKDINETEKRLDILVNNAGAGVFKNHILKMQSVSDLLKKSAPSRVVIVSSISAAVGKLNINNLNAPSRFFATASDYATAKLCNLLFTIELAQKLKGTGVTVNAVHPGVVKSDLHKDSPTMFLKFMTLLMMLFYKSTEAGAQTLIYAAIAKELNGVSGKYFGECEEITFPQSARNDKLAKMLWKKSEEFVKLTADEKRNSYKE